MTSGDLVYLVLGIGLLLAVALPRLVRYKAFSAPIGFVAVGLVLGAAPLPVPVVDPLTDARVVEHLTEVCVVVALMGVGLALDRPLGWRRWGSTWRLLALAMPLCIAAMAVLGHRLLGLAVPAALLLGACLAPTDPVLATDVQVGGPSGESDSEDDVRFTLTSEAGLNDALAFPFVYLSIFAATYAGTRDYLARWLAWELVGKVLVGVAVGAAVGWVVARLAFDARDRRLRFADADEALVALAATFAAYGASEVIGGYGFLSVFVAAVTIRAYERNHRYHEVLHHFTEQIERGLTLVLLLLLGGACANGLLDALTWPGVAVAVLLVLVVRPVAGWVSLLGSPVSRRDRLAIAFFGVRGIGSFYYLAYAAGAADYPELAQLWSVVALAVVLSVVVHGVTATPVMWRLDARRP